MTIIFNHIPKTAGASFRSLLKRQYPTSFYETADDNLRYDINRFLGFSCEKQNSYKLILGHCAQFCDLNIEDSKTIVFLRDPFQQMMSTYYQIRKNSNNKWHQVSKSCKSVVEVSKFIQDYGLNNIQTRFLASDKNLIDLLETKNGVMPPITDSDFQKARRKLAGIEFIGITEYFDESVLLFRRKIGWGTPYYSTRNKTSSQNRIVHSENEREQVKEAQYFDYKIYTEALQHFNNHLSQENISSLQLSIFRLKNYFYNLTHRMNRKF